MATFRFPGGPGREPPSAMVGEIAWAPTSRGELSLRRRPGVGAEPARYELRLNGACLTSSQFAVGALELVRRALAGLAGDKWAVMVGGLGLGFTAGAVLDDPRVASLLVFEETREIVDWSRMGLVPDGARVIADPRTGLVSAELPAALGQDPRFPEMWGPRFDALIVNVTHPSSTRPGPARSAFRTAEDLRAVSAALRPDGVFALWSDIPPDMAYVQALRSVFVDVVARPLAFEDPLQGLLAVHTMYVARGGGRNTR